MSSAGAGDGSQPEPGTVDRRRALRAWLPVLAWAGLIWALGSDGFGAPGTSRIIGPLLHWLVPDISGETVAAVQFLIRKLAHLFEYGVFALLTWRALRSAGEPRERGDAGLALLAVLCLSLADESRQAVSSVRTGSPWDVLLDCAGGLVALALGELAERRLGLRLLAPRPATRRRF